MCEEDEPPAGSARPVSSPAEARLLLADLISQRDRAEARRRELTDEIRATLRRAYDLGMSWAEIAEAAGYRTAEAARVQALRKDDRPPDTVAAHPSGSYSIRDAAEILGVSSQTIYDWIKSGRIRVAVDRPRHRRVFLPNRATPLD